MQKQAKLAFSFAPIDLDDDFPFSVSARYEQPDRPITSLHLHEVPELGYCLDGNGIFVVGQQVMPFRAGDAVIIMDREMHLAQSVRGTVSHWHWVYFDAERLGRLLLPNPELFDFRRFRGAGFANVIHPEESPELVRLIREMVMTGGSSLPFRRERLTALLWLWAAELQTVFPATSSSAHLREPGPEKLSRLHPALLYLNRNYQRALDLDALARRCHVSTPHFCRCFKQMTGIAPLEYLHRLRIGIALAELRRGEKSIGEIALDCGFRSLSSFNRQFKQQTGVAPRDWRRQQND